jgi:hypothetical protein
MNTKKTVLALLLAGSFAASSFATLLEFTNWKADGVLDNATNINTATITTADGVTFDLTIETSGPLDMNSAGTKFGVTNTDIDVGEWVKFSLSASGTQLQTLSLIDLVTGGLTDPLENVSVSDGTTANTVVGFASGGVQFDYADEMAGLTELSTSNVGGQGDGTWEVTLTGLSGTSAARFKVLSMNMDYAVIPEPATIGMLAFMGGGILWVRRTFMV